MNDFLEFIRLKELIAITLLCLAWYACGFWAGMITMELVYGDVGFSQMWQF